MLRTIITGLGVLVGAASAVAATNDAGLALWRDPEFHKQFLGTYGVRAEVEPRVATVEKELMENVLAVMGAKGGAVKARKLLEQSTKPASSAVFDFTLANLLFQDGQFEPAVRAYERAIAKFPSFLRAHKNLGLVHVRAGAFDRAVEPLARAVELGAGDGLTYGLLGYAYTMTEQFTPAESAYRLALFLQPRTLDWKVGLARCLFKLNQYGEAAQLCGELMRTDGNRADYWLLQANAYLGMKLPLKAAENYEYLDLVGAATVATLCTLGDIYVNEGLPELAAGAYGRALDRGRDEKPERFIRNAEVLAARGAHADAASLIARIRERGETALATDDRKRLLKLEARLAAARGAASGEQARLLDEIVALDPLDGEALILLAQHHAAAGDVERAIFLFERAEGIEASEAEARLRHGQCLVKQGRYAEALPLLKRAQELRPRDEVARYIEQVERAARLRSS